MQVPSSAAQDADSADSIADDDALTGPRVSHLPPLCLDLRFPADYPSAAMAVAHISAVWLTADAAQLLYDELLDVWHEQVRPL